MFAGQNTQQTPNDLWSQFYGVFDEKSKKQLQKPYVNTVPLGKGGNPFEFFGGDSY